MPAVLRREALALEDVAQVAAAARAHDLVAVPVGVRLAPHRTRDLFVEAGPAAPRMELRLRTIERRVALAADVGPCGLVVGVLADERTLGALVHDHAGLFGRERVELRHGVCLAREPRVNKRSRMV